jgi:hypothetical protein
VPQRLGAERIGLQGLNHQLRQQGLVVPRQQFSITRLNIQGPDHGQQLAHKRGGRPIEQGSTARLYPKARLRLLHAMLQARFDSIIEHFHRCRPHVLVFRSLML